MAANILNYFLPMTRFLDTEIAPAIKPTPKIRVKMLTQSLGLMAGTYGR